MLLEPTPELEVPPKRGKTLIVSVLVHVLLVTFLVLEPGLFDSRAKRVIRVEGNDYDATQLTELELQPPLPRVASPKVPEKPLVQPPEPVKPPPPEPPPPPVHVITPDDVLAPGAKPDGQVQASRGGTTEPLKQGGASESPAPAPKPNPPAPTANSAPGTPNPSVAQNTNPNALAVPDLRMAANRIADNAIRRAERGGTGSGGTMGAKTGRANGSNGQNFSADGGYQILSDTKGYDFGPYMNQVLNRVRGNWLIPDSAIFGKKGRVVIDFTITKSGDVVDCHIISDSGERSLDGAAKAAIDSSNPFQRLPAGFSGDQLDLRFAFYYNTPVE